MSLRTILSNYGFAFQRELFPALEEELGPLGERYELFVTVLGFVQVERFLTCLRGLPGRPQEDRAALARAFIAKAVFAITTTRGLVERLAIDSPLRRLCGWSRAEEVPSEATFSRAFTPFADSALPSRLHEALIDKTLRDHLVGHVSRDSTAIEGREKPTPKPSATPKRRRGRPRKGEQRPKASRRLEVRQRRSPTAHRHVAGSVAPGRAATVTGQRRARRMAHAKAVFLTPDPEPPGEVVDVQGLRPVTRRGQNDSLRQVVIVRATCPHFDVAHTVGPAEADFLPLPALTQNAEQVTDRETHHEAATTVLKLH